MSFHGRSAARAWQLSGAFVLWFIGCFGPASAQVRPAPAPVVVPNAVLPIVLPHPPPVTNITSSVLFDALLAISRAQLIDPQAAQNASFAYVQAVQQYRAGNFSGANISALHALGVASQAQVRAVVPAPVPALPPASPPQLPGLEGGLYGADAPAIDADTFLALARGILDDCAKRRDPNLARAKSDLARAQQAFSARNWEATRREAKAAIDACAKPER